MPLVTSKKWPLAVSNQKPLAASKQKPSIVRLDAVSKG